MNVCDNLCCIVTHRRESFDSSSLNCNDEWRGCGSTCEHQLLVGIRNEETDHESAENIEQENTDIYPANSFGKVATRVLGLAGSNLGK